MNIFKKFGVSICCAMFAFLFAMPSQVQAAFFQGKSNYCQFSYTASWQSFLYQCSEDEYLTQPIEEYFPDPNSTTDFVYSSYSQAAIKLTIEDIRFKPSGKIIVRDRRVFFNNMTSAWTSVGLLGLKSVQYYDQTSSGIITTYDCSFPGDPNYVAPSASFLNPKNYNMNGVQISAAACPTWLDMANPALPFFVNNLQSPLPFDLQAPFASINSQMVRGSLGGNSNSPEVTVGLSGQSSPSIITDYSIVEFSGSPSPGFWTPIAANDPALTQAVDSTGATVHTLTKRVPFHLANTNGNHTVAVFFRNALGKVSNPAVDSITLVGQELNRDEKNEFMNAIGICPLPNASVGDPVNTNDGTFYDTRHLMNVTGAVDLTFALHYNSNRLSASSVGWGWNHQYAIMLTENPGGVRIHWADGNLSIYAPNGTGGYTVVSGSHQDVLVKHADGSFTLTDRGHRSYQFDTTQTLVSISDAHGRTTNLTYVAGNLDRITDAMSVRFIQLAYDVSNRITSISGAGAGTVVLTYDLVTGDLASVIDALAHATQFTYDLNHRLLTRTNAAGVVELTNVYDAQGRVVSQGDGMATTPLVTYNYGLNVALGTKFTQYTDRSGAVTQYNFNTANQLTSVADPLGNTRRYGYNGGERNYEADAMGNASSWTQDAAGYVTSKTDAMGRVTTYAYDVSHNLTSTTDAAGNISSYTYDANRNMLTKTNASAGVMTYAYNAQGQVLTVTSPLKGRTTYTYDANGQMATRTDATGYTTSFGYDAAGRNTTMTDAAGNITTNTYDLNGHLTSITDALGNVASFAYDVLGRRTSTTDANGNITSFTYDGNDRLISIARGASNTTTYAYDGEGRIVSTTDALGNTYLVNYDANGRAISATDALGHISTKTYDAVGRMVADTNALGDAMQYAYDASYRLIASTDPLKGNTSRIFDVAGNLTQVTDALGRNTGFAYDALHQLTQVTDKAGQLSSQSFDADGRRMASIDSNSNTTTFTFDAVGRVIKAQTADGSNTSFVYNNMGLVANATNGRGQVATYAYDASRRMISITDPAGTVTFSYDANGNVLTISDAVGTTTRSFDALNRMSTLTDTYGNVISYGYDAVGNLTTLTYPGGKVVTYAYDAGNRMISVTDWAGRVTTYAYNIANRLTNIAHADGTSTLLTYDSKGQVLSRVEKKVDATDMYRINYTYDAHGNLTAEQGLSIGTPTTGSNAMTYGADNRLATFKGNAVVFDGDGNMTSGPLAGAMTTFAYDARGRLTRAGGETYGYDAENNLIAATVAGVTTRYVVDANAGLPQVLMKTDAAGVVQAYYIYGLALIAEDVAGQYRTYHYDSRGSSLRLTDAAGVVTDSYQYDPFGALITSTGATDNPFKYNGRDGVITRANGLYYMRARFFDTDIKRFISRDKLLGRIEQAQTLNRFAYVQGNPINFVDPSGFRRSSGDGINPTQDASGMCDSPKTFAEIKKGFQTISQNRGLSEKQKSSLFKKMKQQLAKYKANTKEMDKNIKDKAAGTVIGTIQQGINNFVNRPVNERSSFRKWTEEKIIKGLKMFDKPFQGDLLTPPKRPRNSGAGVRG